MWSHVASVHGSNVLNGRAASFLGPAAGSSETFVPVYQATECHIQYFLPLVLFSLCAFLLTVFVLCVLLSSYVYLLYYVCIAVLL
jgi:hypothetical protein